MVSFGERLKAERHRLGMTQAQMAAIVEISTNSQNAYEHDAVSPPEKYLSHLIKHGVDINFLFTGEYAASGASRQISELLAVLNQLPPAHQATAFAVMSLYQAAPPANAGSVEQADQIWRAARLFKKFLGLSDEGKSYVEKAAEVEG